MRTLMLALSATALAVPASFALPTDSAEAQSRYYRNGYYYGPPGAAATAGSIAAVRTAPPA